MTSGRDPDLDELAELRRIRAAYDERDGSPGRNPAIVEAHRIVTADRMARMRAMIQGAPGDHPTILDVGCGGGYDLEYWLSNGWPADSLAGVDLIESRIAAARKRCPDVDLRVISGVDLPFATDSFDVATAMTVFSSILDPTVRRRVFAEMRRVVRPGGSILVYDFVIRKPGNVDVVAMTPRRLRSMAGPPAESISITPLVHAIALASRLGSFATRVAMALGPRTHRLSRWVPEGQRTQAASGRDRPF